MVFSSFEFLFRFLPFFLLIYYVTPQKWKNAVLFAGSILFYTAGEAEYVVLLLVASFDEKTNTISCIIGAYAEKDYTGNEIVVMDLTGKRLLDKVFDKFYAHHDIRRMPDGNQIGRAHV